MLAGQKGGRTRDSVDGNEILEVCMSSSTAQYGEYPERDCLQIQRFLPGPIERVWKYLTDSELRRRWLAAGDMLPEAGSEFEFVWRNNELDGGPVRGKAADDPECAVEEFHMRSQIVAWEPPRLLSFSWKNSGDVTIALEERGDEVLLTLTHYKLPDEGTIVGVSAGWHAHLDYLLARLKDEPPVPFWDNHNRLQEVYEQRVKELGL